MFYFPFKNCDILTIDGHGELDTCFLELENKDIKQNQLNTHSVGLFYGTFLVTRFKT